MHIKNYISVGVSPLQMDSPSCYISRLSSLQRSLCERSPRTDFNIQDCVKLRRGFSHLSFMYLLFSSNIFLITHFRVVLSFHTPPLDHNNFKQLSLAQICSLNVKKLFYFKLFSLTKKVKWFQVLLCITNNSINHQSFIYTQL